MKSTELNINNIFVAVFSYDRGKYLDNCIESIERNLSTKNIHIYDDGSNDSRTITALKKLANKHYVEINEHKPRDKNFRRGGLYFNMNRALENAIKNNFTYCFFIQDDMQIIRPCDERFFLECNEIFASDDSIAQIHPKFLNNEDAFVVHKCPDYYYNKRNDGFGIYDGGLIKVEKLIRSNWVFDPSEPLNVVKAKKLKLKTVFHKNPIFSGLPWPETYNQNSFIKNAVEIIIDKVYGAGFYPYNDMTDEVINKLLDRPIENFPIAENWLTIKDQSRIKKPWAHTRSSAVLFKTLQKKKRKILSNDN